MTTFYADISEFQTVVTDAYPYPVLAFRVDNGQRIDYHAAGNWNHARASSRIQVVIAYVVFQPGQRAAILARVKRFFGPNPPKLVLMIDMESGPGFAGPGNHSTEANGLAQDFASYLGSRQRVLGYANHYDYQSNWPTRPAWLKLVTASYGTQNPGTYAWQFYGGVPNPRPVGYPGSCPPFGSSVDLNAIQRTPAQIVADFGLAPGPAPVHPPTPIEEIDMSNSFGYAIDPKTLQPGVGGNCFWKEPGQKPAGPISGDGILGMAHAVGQPGVTSLANLPVITLSDHEALGGVEPLPVVKP